jgi:hypothetical protein
MKAAIEILTDFWGRLYEKDQIDYSQYGNSEEDENELETIHQQLLDDWGAGTTISTEMVFASFATLADEQSEIKSRIDEASAPF